MAEGKADAGGSFRDEADLVRTVFAPLAGGAEGAFGLADDAALFTPRPGEELVLTADMIVAGVHFLPDCPPADIGYKALAVNVSDLVAKGAEPACYVLSIALEKPPDRRWLEALAAGLGEAQADFGCVLLGGDTVSTPGALCVSVTAVGRVPEGGMMRRSGARPGDRLYVTGTIGDAAAGLKLLLEGEPAASGVSGDTDTEFLKRRHRRPKPNPALAGVLREHAGAAMDVSDGLAGDFAKMCAASGCGGVIDGREVPLSGPACALMRSGFVTLEHLLAGGDDYEVLAAVPAEKGDGFERAAAEAGSRATRIGTIEQGESPRLLGKDGHPVQLSRPGYDHF